MRACAVTLASLVLASSSVVAFEECPTGATNVWTDNACCSTTASPRRRRLFSRADKCSDGTEPCCTAKAPGPPEVESADTTKNLQCGHDFTDTDPNDETNGVTYDIAPCPDPGEFAGQICFHVQLTADASQTIKEGGIHLAILASIDDLDDLPNGLGNWPHNDYCDISGNVGDCWVPLSVVEALLDPPTLCGKEIIVAAGISLDAGDTCFAQGTVIDETGRWFMYTPISFTSCPDVCTQSCCCPPPPPQTHSCDFGTAFGYRSGLATTFNPSLTPNSCKRWGWYFKLTPTQLASPLTGTLYVGAGGNDINKATAVGTFSAQLSGTALTVTYTLNSPYDLSEVHIYASCVSPPTCAPGQYGNPATQPDLSGTTDTSFQTTITVGPCTDYYLIFHARINKIIPISDPCPTPVP